MDNDLELIIGFTQEARDYLDEVEPALIEISEESNDSGCTDSELINGVFRLFHSMKGSAGFLQLNTVAAVTHEAETLLDKIRKGKAVLTVEITQLLCRTLDFFRVMLDSIEENGNDEGFDNEAEAVKRELIAACGGKTGSPAAVAISTEPAGEQPPAQADTTPVAESPEKTKKTRKIRRKIVELKPVVHSEPIMDIGPEMLTGFVQEGAEQLDAAEHALLSIDENEENKEFLNEAFRNIHSFKGNCGFMGFGDLETISHRMETVLDLMREGIILPESGNTGVLLSMIDVLREVVNNLSLEENSSGGIESLEIYLELINEMIPEEEVEEEIEDEEGADAGDKEVAEDEAKEVAPAENVEPVADMVDSGAVSAALSAPVSAEPKPVPAAVSAAPASVVTPGSKPMPPAAGQTEKELADKKSTERARRAIRQDIRVDLNKLDSLINLVGELVIAESMVTRNPAAELIEDENYYRAVHQLRRICDDLQDVAMSVRMIPVSGTFRKMIRLVHDLSHKAQKKIKLNIIGEETEVDKTVIEQIADPLVHIVRNSCDHGIEVPSERINVGKNETGNVTIEARHEGGEVWIIITDDGRGLNKPKILAKAIERGLVKGDGSDLSDEKIFKLVFEPGFSTADKITDISGRGVGMDVVKKNIEKLNGRIDVRSSEGMGSTFILRIPLTLAIIDGMLVRVGNTKYTIPVLSIRETLKPDRSMITYTPEGNEILSLRDSFIPVIRLHELFGTKADSTVLEDGILVIVEDSGVPIAMFIDEIVGQQQTVIKGLSEYIGKARGCSGCTILGDGSVSLILDLGTLMAMAQDTLGQLE